MISCGTVAEMATPIALAAPRIDRGVLLDERIAGMLARNAAVAFGVSGGKDGCAGAFAVWEHLDRIGHTGPRCLVHSDLGSVEWDDSMPTCERLARALDAELVIVRRPQGGMMERWRQRWTDNVRRYATLSCVKLILPWSTPDMRFCTSELKIAQINRGLVERWPGREIVSAAGIRRQESRQRQRAEISKINKGLAKVRARTSGATWNPILHWLTGDVFAMCKHRGFEMHEGYRVHGMKRISCRLCIMQDADDMRISAWVPGHESTVLDVAALEIESTYGFQGARWVADLRPDLLSDAQRIAVADAKRRGAERERAEAWLPDHLLYTDGWPTVMPTTEEAAKIARMRREVAGQIGIDVQYTTGAEVTARYAELMAINATKNAKKKNKTCQNDAD